MILSSAIAPPGFPLDVVLPYELLAWRHQDELTLHYSMNGWAFMDVPERRLVEAPHISHVFEEMERWVRSCVWAQMPGHEHAA